MSTLITIWNILLPVWNILVIVFGTICLIALAKAWRNRYKNKDTATVVAEVKMEGVLVPADTIMDEVYKKEITQEKLCEIFEKNNRILKVNGSIEANSGWLTRALLSLDAESSEDITLIIDSPGGNIDAGRSIIETMNLLRSDVSTIIIGRACSMSATIAISGAKGKRYATKNSNIMIHDGFWTFNNPGVKYNYHDLDVLSTELRKDREFFINLYAEHTKNSREEIIDKLLKGDTWMTADEALKLGYIDGILLKGLTSADRVIQR